MAIMSPRRDGAGRKLRFLRVLPRPPGLAGAHRATLVAGPVSVPCVLGPAGIVRRKREGDGGTPAGRFALMGGCFRPDRQPRPVVPVAVRPSRPLDGWCDDPSRGCYNRPVTLPFPASHERLWREDRLYDVLLVLDYNMWPRRRGAGSAIFLHVMAKDGTATAGCVALRPADLRRLLARLAPGCRLLIG